MMVIQHRTVLETLAGSSLPRRWRTMITVPAVLWLFLKGRWVGVTVMDTGSLDRKFDGNSRAPAALPRSDETSDGFRRARIRPEEQGESGISGSESEEFAQALGLSAADRNLGLLLVVHSQLVGT